MHGLRVRPSSTPMHPSPTPQNPQPLPPLGGRWVHAAPRTEPRTCRPGGADLGGCCAPSAVAPQLPPCLPRRPSPPPCERCHRHTCIRKRNGYDGRPAASCTPAPAQPARVRMAVSGVRVLRTVLLKWGKGWVSASASAGRAACSRYLTRSKIRSRCGADSCRSFGRRTPAPAHNGNVGCMWGLDNGGMGVGQLWLQC